MNRLREPRSDLACRRDAPGQPASLPPGSALAPAHQGRSGSTRTSELAQGRPHRAFPKLPLSLCSATWEDGLHILPLTKRRPATRAQARPHPPAGSGRRGRAAGQLGIPKQLCCQGRKAGGRGWHPERWICAASACRAARSAASSWRSGGWSGWPHPGGRRSRLPGSEKAEGERTAEAVELGFRQG